MAVGGLAKDNDGANNTILAAKEILNYITNFKSEITDKWNIRIGLSSGKVTGGIVGIKKYAFDYFGETVNLASRMEKNCKSNKINISEFTYELTKDNFKFIDRGKIEVKGFGLTQMYFVK
jgi:class 3 adenylate cyclase